ncbi:hypothetical protein PInf_010014 [Phytophthora infestans]|nr:hypothetical protein PInf_010014 [Phytophthora infestans]
MVSAALSSRPSSVQRTCYAKENDTHHTESKARQSAMREQIRREQQRRRMVKWRKQKKEKKINMVDERRRLEKELQRHVLQARIALNNVTIRSAAEAYRHVTVERAALMSENVALREAIEKKVKAQAQVEREVQEFLGQLHTEESSDLVRRYGDGWRVQFANGAPSFYFSPFTREEFDNVFKDNDVTENFLRGPRSIHETVALPSRQSAQDLTPPRQEYLASTSDATKLGHFSDWNQLLKSFDENAVVMVGNIPGDVHLRYLVAARHSRERRSDGKRVDKYIMTIADSAANLRNRQAEGEQKDVQWVLQGGWHLHDSY